MLKLKQIRLFFLLLISESRKAKRVGTPKHNQIIMKKLLFTLSIALTAFTFQANAQSNIGVNLSTALPIGDFSDFTNFGVGGGISYDYYFNDKFDLGLEAEFLAFPVDAAGIDGSFGLIPILVTGGYHTDYGNEIDFYGELGAGAFLGTNPLDDEISTNFGISPRIGIAIELGNRLFFDASIRYGLVFDAQEATTETITSNGFTFTTETAATGNTSYLGLNLGILYTLTE